MRFAAANVINAVDVLQYSSIHVTTTDKKKPKTPKKKRTENIHEKFYLLWK